MSAVDKRHQDVVLHIEIAIDDGGLLFAEFGQILDALQNTVVINVIRCRFGPEIGSVAEVLLGE